MNTKNLTGHLYAELIKSGASNLRLHCQEVNNLNVFPIPDGDTGDNMLMTISVAAAADYSQDSDLNLVSSKISSAMLLGARGNSGVILSQFFDGIAAGFYNTKEADIEKISAAFLEGVNHAYAAVMTPVEGTILTVAKDSVKIAVNSKPDTLEEFVDILISEAKKSLKKTPDLLDVLKKAGVVDSGGAGLIYIYEGFKAYLEGKELSSDYSSQITETHSSAQKTAVDISKFTEDSILEYGYCTEILLRLQKAKCNPSDFDICVIKDFLNKTGNSVVIFKTDSIVKIHVHTMTPDKILAFCQQFGEFLTVKIENMSLQHNSLGEDAAGKESHKQQEEIQEHKAVGFVAVASGDGIKQLFTDNNVNYVIDGGQSMNPSSHDFLKAFEIVNADTIFVLPNNSNVILAAKQAAELYKKADVRVINSTNIGEGYGAISMYDPECQDITQIEQQLNQFTTEILNYEITRCIRDAEMDGVKLKNGDYIAISGKKIIAHSSDLYSTAKDIILKADFTNHEICIILRGKTVTEKEGNELCAFVESNYRGKEVYLLDGQQEIYNYIIILM